MKKYQLDNEEREILDAIESSEWKIIKPTKSKFKQYAKIAKDTKEDLKAFSKRGSEGFISYEALLKKLKTKQKI